MCLCCKKKKAQRCSEEAIAVEPATAIYSLYSLHVSTLLASGDLLLPGGGAEESGGGARGATPTHPAQPHLAG